MAFSYRFDAALTIHDRTSTMTEQQVHAVCDVLTLYL
jgi:hypothetical protein